MIKWTLKTLLRMRGWRVDMALPKGYQRSVMVAAPHTSNWDAFFMLAASIVLGMRIRYAIKKEWLKPPIGWLLGPLGGIGIDRSPREPGGKRTSTVEAMVNLFKKRKQLTLIIPPEGTRKPVSQWKTGFYHVAVQAKVPLMLSYVDYGRKIIGVKKEVPVTGNFEKDLGAICSFYKEIKPRFPEKFLLDERAVYE